MTTSMLRVSDPRRAELLMPGLLHREGASGQSAIPSIAATTLVRARAIDILQVLLSPSRRRIISTERLGWVAVSRTCLCGDPPTSHKDYHHPVHIFELDLQVG